jgi:hypothetical protein
MTALILGLLTASAKSSFDAQRAGLAQLTGNVIMVDRALAHYGPEAKDVREMLRASVADMLRRTWPDENPGSDQAGGRSGTEGRYEGVYEAIQGLAPKTDAQRAWQAQAMKIATDIGQLRWQLFAQRGRSIPTPLLAVMVGWLAVLFASFSLFAPPNSVVLTTLVVCALAIASTIFLILELERPFEGVIQVSSAPLRNALEQLGR